MKVKALTNIKYGGWHYAGEIFEIRDADFEEMKGAVERAEAAAPAPSREAKDEVKNEKSEKPARTSTRRKKE